ncbi:MAG: DUF1573 domain-containing protein [Desulfobacteraceae bacterium]|nr:DUF1573 domain-containing protein [Desulfobacteraceae bacterium]
MRNCKNLLFFIILLFLSYNPAWADLLKCDAPIKDFGEIKETEKLSHVFIVKNITANNISVSRIITSCGCITPLKKNLPLKAGEEVEVPIEFNSMGYGGMKLQKDIYLFVGDELSKPALILTIRGQVVGIPPQERIDVIPQARYISDDINKKYYITIRGPADKNLEISTKAPEWLDVKMGKPQKHQEFQVNQWDLEFSLNRKLEKRIDGNLVITTNLPLFEELSVPIYVEPMPMVIADPPVLFIEKENLGEICTKELEITLLKNSYGESIKHNNSVNIETTKPESSGLKNSQISLDINTLPILVEPSNDCLSVKLTKVSQGFTKVKYKISFENCPSSRLNLRIMVGKTCIQKVPVCFLHARAK